MASDGKCDMVRRPVQKTLTGRLRYSLLYSFSTDLVYKYVDVYSLLYGTTWTCSHVTRVSEANFIPVSHSSSSLPPPVDTAQILREAKKFDTNGVLIDPCQRY